jgi:hypothetical protein
MNSSDANSESPRRRVDYIIEAGVSTELGLRLWRCPQVAHFRLARTGPVWWSRYLCSTGGSAKVNGTSLRPPQCAQASSRLAGIRLTTVSSYLTACAVGAATRSLQHIAMGPGPWPKRPSADRILLRQLVVLALA